MPLLILFFVIKFLFVIIRLDSDINSKKLFSLFSIMIEHNNIIVSYNN